MKKKKSVLESETIIIFAVVFMVVLLVLFFVFRTRIDLWIKNLPDYQQKEGGDVEILPDEVTISLCPEGYEIIGRFETGVRTPNFIIKDENNFKTTKIEWVLGNNKIIIDKWGPFIEINLGEITPFKPHSKKIHIDKKVFQRGNDKFNAVLKKELIEGEEFFKYLILLDNAEVLGLGGTNYICQKKEIIENLTKKLNLIY